ncbi:Hut1p [Saccharomyces cerevisiae x Saccharomyces kudriavzevii VIN7]|uniref:UDP-galactose transporter homolog 1 n=1 Tax=Saccharomyces cerevisiae x Saccharomyces kudriavzevii (strain VIN7) TaxID=1095631 RepID=H0H1R6_SACCK|nr:Hut1p [Saccharomyces cerevisiae x Saccharomyces kudriavzevii VIN7]
MAGSTSSLAICAIGIYATFLTWALIQEPLATRTWPNSKEKFQFPNVIALMQATVAMMMGYLYLKWKKVEYSPLKMIQDHWKQLMLISLTQSSSGPLATTSLKYVDYLTYMLAKSCKMIPVLLVHLLLYRTPISSQKKVVAILVSLGVTIFTIGGKDGKKLKRSLDGDGNSHKLQGFGLLSSSLFLDGLTNATQDRLLKANKAQEKGERCLITGAHLMFTLNLFVILWNILYLIVVDYKQWENSVSVLMMDSQVWSYLMLYSVCGATGQCFIFYTLEKFGSLILIMITVTRKMVSMVLSIVVFGKSVCFQQWVGIFIVFGGITWEALNKKKASIPKAKSA